MDVLALGGSMGMRVLLPGDACNAEYTCAAYRGHGCARGSPARRVPQRGDKKHLSQDGIRGCESADAS